MHQRIFPWHLLLLLLFLPSSFSSFLCNLLLHASNPLLASAIPWPTPATCFASLRPTPRPRPPRLHTGRLFSIIRLGDSPMAASSLISSVRIYDDCSLDFGIGFLYEVMNKNLFIWSNWLFAAEEFGLPLVPPFYGGKINGGGVNFAVAGSTALPDSVYAKQGVPIPYPNVSLTAQLSWFKREFLPAFCHQPPSKGEVFKYLISL